MTIDEMVDGVLDAIHNAAHRSEEPEVAKGVAAWLEKRGWYCCDGDTELRDRALSETDLVEPDKNE